MTGPSSGTVTGSQDPAVPSWEQLAGAVLADLRNRDHRGHLRDLRPILERVHTIRTAEAALLDAEAAS